MHSAQCTIFLITLCIAACSVPRLEPPQCTEARDAVKRFYSLHVAGDMRPSAEISEAKRAFLTEGLIPELALRNDTERDYFTASENYPKAFRVGECNSDNEKQAIFDVMLLWRDDTSIDQKHVFVETVKVNDKWLIAKVSEK